jgi:hypothetical protein
MKTRGYLLSSIGVVVLLGGLARPAHAVKQTNYAMGAACQPATLLNVVSPLTYTNAGVMNQNLLPVDVVCPLTWSKQQAVASWQNLAEVDIEVDWLGLPAGVTGLFGPTWGCTLAYQTAGGSLSMQNLPIPYPLPAAMPSMAYGALICTIPSSMGIQGFEINMCFTSATNPGGCQP